MNTKKILGTVLWLAMLPCLAIGSPAWGSYEPVIFWASDPIEPSETLLVTGDQLQSVTQVTFQRLDDSMDSQPSAGRAISGEILQRSNHSLKLAVPPSLKPGVFRYTLTSALGSYSGTLNTATIYWKQGDAGTSATQGGWIQIFGRNVSRGPRATAVLTQGGEEKLRVPLSQGGQWSATFSIARNVPAGNYQLWLWNGQGDRSTWIEAGELGVLVAKGNDRKIVMAGDFGARGNRSTDDTDAIAASLKAASDLGGGIVKLAEGNYRVTRTIKIPPGVTLEGAGIDTTSLNWPDFAQPLPTLISGDTDFGLTHLTVVTGRHFDVISGGFSASDARRDGKNITISHVRVRANSYSGRVSNAEANIRSAAITSFHRDGVAALRLGGENLVIDNCDIISSARSVVLIRPKSSRVFNNIFINGRAGWYSISGGDRVIFENNVVAGGDLQATGGGINTLGSGPAASQNIAFRSNKFQNILGWDREAITSDGPGGYYYGGASSIGRDVIELANGVAAQIEPDDWAGATVFILAGTGRGLTSEVLLRSRNRVVLAKALPVALDQSSIVTIVKTQRRYIIDNNEFSDVGVAIQIFGTGLEHVVSDNRLVRAGGLVQHGLYYGHPQPVWYSQFLRNTILTADPGAPSKISVRSSTRNKVNEVLNYGAIIRGNVFQGATDVEIGGDAEKGISVSDAIFELNVSQNARVTLSLSRDVGDVLVRENVGIISVSK